uniref:Uncharacterized protein n=1 Tax=Glossina austeni TaxID=7395 RepID=A0A1A9V6P8_GLOAU
MSAPVGPKKPDPCTKGNESSPHRMKNAPADLPMPASFLGFHHQSQDFSVELGGCCMTEQNFLLQSYSSPRGVSYVVSLKKHVKVLLPTMTMSVALFVMTAVTNYFNNFNFAAAMTITAFVATMTITALIAAMTVSMAIFMNNLNVFNVSAMSAGMITAAITTAMTVAFIMRDNFNNFYILIITVIMMFMIVIMAAAITSATVE